jgi:type IV pilus assembly protein PilB
MTLNEEQFKEFLIEANIINGRELANYEEMSKKTGQSLQDFLLNKNIISEEDLMKIAAYLSGIPYINLEKEIVPPEILQIIPEPVARKHNIIAFKKRGRELQVAMLDPKDLQTIDFIKKKTNLKISPRLTSSASIKNILRQYQRGLRAELEEIIGKEIQKISVKVGEKPEELKKVSEDLSIIKFVDTILKQAILQDASDIHLEPMEKELVLRFRIDGILHEAMTFPKELQSALVARIKVLSNLRLDEHRLPQDGRFKIETSEYKYSFRVSVMPIFEGEKVVLRLLPEEAHGFTLETLGFWGRDLELLHKHIRKTVGMILVTGPTGSGKTTPLYTVLDILNTPRVNISTVEDPIEYRMPRINQTQVNPKIGLTFANGLRALVRQDPDIIMVGEIRDIETASLAINAALTGHLVLSTLHTNSAAGALPRLLDMKVDPFLIASTVNVIEAQRLVRVLSPDKEKYQLTSSEIQALGKDIDLDRLLTIMKKEKIVDQKADWPDISFYKAVPSERFPDGYKGRIGIHEIMEVSPAIKELIVKEVHADEIEKQAQKEGMITMIEDGLVKAVQGITTIEEVLRVIQE